MIGTTEAFSMRSFQYIRPESLSEVFDLLKEYGPRAKLLAGGTDVLAQLRRGMVRQGQHFPELVIDLKRVPELRDDIVEADGYLRIGSRAVMRDIIRDSRVRQFFPALAESAKVVGSVQIRNRATLTGNMCNASPAADTAPALLVHGAVLNLVSEAGSRTAPLNEFFLGPGKTILKQAELVQSIDLPIPAGKSGSAFGRVQRQWGVDLATMNVCCLVQASGPTRFAYGAVGPTPFVVEDGSGVLSGRNGNPEAKDSVLKELIAHASPISDVRGSQDYRQAMLMVMSRRALETALDRMHGAEVQV